MSEQHQPDDQASGSPTSEDARSVDPDPWAAAYATLHGGSQPPAGWSPPLAPRFVDDGTGLGATQVQCPFCREQIRADAVVCKHCRRDVEAQLPTLLDSWRLHEEYQRIVGERVAIAGTERDGVGQVSSVLVDREVAGPRKLRKWILIPMVAGLALVLAGGSIAAYIGFAGVVQRTDETVAAAETAESEADIAAVAAEEEAAAARFVEDARIGSISSCRAVYGTDAGRGYLSNQGLSLESKCDRMTDAAVKRWADPAYATRTARSLTENGAPAGFWRYAAGLSAKWADGDDLDFVCGDANSCWNLLVYAGKSCPGGMYAEITVEESETGVVRQSIGNMTPALAAGETARLVFEVPQSETSLRGELTDLVCNP